VNLRRAAALVFVVLLGCGTEVQGPAFQKAAVVPAMSAIYVYRPKDRVPKLLIVPLVETRAKRPSVNCQGQAVAIGPGGYHRFVVQPGTVSCSTFTENTSTVQLDAKAGESYYVKESFQSGIEEARVRLEAVNPDDAQAEISGCKEQ
jgi:hypothetical protein